MLCVLSCTMSSYAIDRYNTRIDTVRTQLVIPRPALQPLKSMMNTGAEPMDTLATVNEFIKVVIYADNTWQYIKLPGYQQNVEIFKSHWNSEVTNPYKLELEDLEESWSLWLVDSLDQYDCPYQGEVHPRGKFGIRRGRRHQGVDIPLKEGAPIYAAFTGQVRMSKMFGGFGNLIVIRHENGIETFYGHLSKRKVFVGDWVNAGDIIGYGGSTGRSTGPHLHFETRYQGFAFDPQWLIDFKSGMLRHRLFVLKKKYFSPYSNYEQDFEDEMKNEADDVAEEEAKLAIRWHIVKKGDTLYSISRANGLTVEQLCKMNKIYAKTPLKIGQKLRVH